MIVTVNLFFIFVSLKLGTKSYTLVITVSVATMIVSRPSKSIVMKNKMAHSGAIGRVVTFKQKINLIITMVWCVTKKFFLNST